MLQRILLPLDGSGDWEYLLPFLEALPIPAASELIVFEAVPFLETLLEMPRALGAFDPAHSGDTELADRFVCVVVEVLRSRGLRARGLTEIGSDIPTLARVAKRERVTLILLPFRAPVSLSYRLFGTALERTLAAISTPLFAVPVPPAGEGLVPNLVSGSVLIPVDGTGMSLQVIPPAAELCRRLETKILFAHVAERGADPQEARRFLEEAQKRAGRESVTSKAVRLEGEPAAEILKLCDERNVSMIAMRTRLALGERHGPLGSVTVALLRAARTPMLILRRARKRTRAPARATRGGRFSGP